MAENFDQTDQLPDFSQFGEVGRAIDCLIPERITVQSVPSTALLVCISSSVSGIPLGESANLLKSGYNVSNIPVLKPNLSASPLVPCNPASDSAGDILKRKISKVTRCTIIFGSEISMLNIGIGKQEVGRRRTQNEWRTLQQHYYPEGGWGWAVVASAVLCHTLTSGAQFTISAPISAIFQTGNQPV